METWLRSFPEDGDFRKKCQDAFERGYLVPMGPEALAARTHSGEIQRFLDNISQIDWRTTCAQQSLFIFTLDKNGKLLVNSGAFEQMLEQIGDQAKVFETMTIWKDQIVQATSGKDDAEKWFSQAVQEQRSLGRLSYTWINDLIHTSLEEISRYKGILPPASQSIYYQEYFQRVYELATGTKPDIAEQIEEDKATERAREEISQFFTDYKWWILGGTAGVGGLYLLWVSL